MIRRVSPWYMDIEPVYLTKICFTFELFNSKYREKFISASEFEGISSWLLKIDNQQDSRCSFTTRNRLSFFDQPE